MWKGVTKPAVDKQPILPGCDVLVDRGMYEYWALPQCSDEFIHHWCAASLLAQCGVNLEAAGSIEVSVQLVDAKSMQVLNHQYRGQNKPTNVLSFNADMPLLPGGLMVLGDIVVCPDVVQREAQQQKKQLAHHCAHMLVHATLHLCGYDHIEPEQAEAMESMEIRILSEAGLSNPYLV